MFEHGSSVDFSTRLSFRSDARNLHFRGCERQQIPRFAGNDKLVVAMTNWL
jgi:hypothetical protein